MRIELSLCAEWGIPHSQFLSWSQDDRDKAMAYVLYKTSVCPRCGTVPEDWWETDEDGNRSPVEPPPYLADTVACLGCSAIEDIMGEVPTNRKATVTPRLIRRNPREKWTWQLKRSQLD